MAEITLIFPHHLIKNSPLLDKERLIIFVEDPLFFYDRHHPVLMHKQKLIFHRSSMKSFEKKLRARGFSTLYVDAKDLADYHKGYVSFFKKHKVTDIFCYEMDDYLLDRRLRLVCDELEISLHIHSSDLFLSSHEMFLEHFHQKKHFFFHSFYIEQRRRLGILLDKGKEPVGGKWSYDTENRKKVPKGLCIPAHIKHRFSEETKESLEYVEKHFSHHVGRADTFRYPVTHEGAEKVLDHFLEHKLALFGDYEDAMMQDERILFHSQLSPLLNVGLLTPEHVISKTLEYAKEHHTPLNSLEGFIRQVIGWREFIRSVYLDSGVKQRKKNFFHHSRRMPSCFYEGTSGITPIDHCIHKLHEGAYLHHIERLMVLGNFFLLCEIDPHDIYRWFMEFFIDSYDWVMVPNVYGMSQFCDGGLMTTKPYFSSSSYILKMSDYGKGSWTEIWDSLFWRFMIKHEAFFKKQPRLNMLLSTAHKKKQDKAFLSLSNDFLDNMQDSTN